MVNPVSDDEARIAELEAELAALKAKTKRESAQKRATRQLTVDEANRKIARGLIDLARHQLAEERGEVSPFADPPREDGGAKKTATDRRLRVTAVEEPNMEDPT